MITDGPPDAPLWEAARSGALASPEGLATQARRLLGAAGAAGGVLRFFREHRALEKVEGVAKDAKAFPSWSSSLAADLARESERLVEDVVWRGTAGCRRCFRRATPSSTSGWRPITGSRG